VIWLLFQAAAITLIITEGSIFGKLRTFGPALWRQLIQCSMCLGTWVGMVLYVLHALPVPGAYWSWRMGMEVLGFGCMAGILAFLGAQLIACLDRWSGPET
jgi:hypothetical protein